MARTNTVPAIALGPDGCDPALAVLDTRPKTHWSKIILPTIGRSAAGPGLPRTRRCQRDELQHLGPDGRRCMMRVDTKGRVREIEGSHVEDVLRAYAGVRSEAQLLRQSPWVSESFYVTLFLVSLCASGGRSVTAHLVSAGDHGRWSAGCVDSGSFPASS